MYHTLQYRMRGVAPLLMHNGRLANPLDHEKSRWMPHSLLWGGKRAAHRAATIPAWPTKQVPMPFMT
jgi:hypothetical protein